MYLKYCIFCFSLFFLYGNVRGVRDITGMDIIPRNERGATEGWGKLYGGAWDSYLDSYNEYESWLAGDANDVDGSFQEKQFHKEINDRRYNFLNETYPSEINTYATVREVNGDRLAWPRSYSHYKSKIVIHHTAGSQVYDTPAVSLVGLQDIYEYHTLTRGRGDIGYNFIVDPYGRVYEGRAGGKGVVGAHTDWNNVSTIGIALMGNFDHYEPTAAAWTSLKQLVLLLSLEYGIDPYVMQPYFRVTDTDPFLHVHKQPSIVGHQDVKTTGCPGHFIDERLPKLRREIADALTVLRQKGIGISFLSYKDHTPSQYFSDVHGTISIPFDIGGKVSCVSLSDTLAVSGCTRGRNNMLDVYVSHDGFPASGIQTIMVTIGSQVYNVTVSLVREKDLELLRNQRQLMHNEQYPSSIIGSSTKVDASISIDTASSLLNNPVNVLLYEVSTTLPDRELTCEPSCTVTTDSAMEENIKNLRIIQKDEQLRVFIGATKIDTEKLMITDAEYLFIDNYDKEYGGVPMQVWRGGLTWEKQQYRHLDRGRENGYTVVNTVDFDEYMQGVGEISQQQHSEKIKAMSLLTKTYMLFYLDKQNLHPAIPEESTYNAIDDPRIFQRYFGAGFEVYSTKRKDALVATKDMLVSYAGTIPVLPYFHCSAGYTRSAREAFGRTDTPWLQSVLDVAVCVPGGFEGHGVGMSGDGAEALAQAGMSFVDIIEWYYNGVEIVSF